jgi:FMN-dependent oxidoreductase (nitrilotriacetate monooxygenase family)
MAKPRTDMIMIAFMQAQNCSNYVGSWRHPAAMSDFTTAQHYQRIARILEEGKFHLAFFDDRLAMPELSDDFSLSVEHGIRTVKMDLIPLLTAMGMATTHLGLGGTYSTTYYEPFHVARVFATLDLMIGGRAAWNVVTSLNDHEAANFGRTEHLEHDSRYDRADEFIECVLGHWATWADDALIVDKESGRFADAGKVRRLDYKGKYFTSRGPFTVPRSPQGQPVIMQAGQSGRGKQFAARWGELIFTVYKSIEQGKATTKELKEEAARLGRDPDTLKIAPAVYMIPGETRQIAKDKMALIDGLARAPDAIALISEVTNFDFSKVPFDQPLSDDQMSRVGPTLGLKDRVVKGSGTANPTPGDFVTFSGRGTIHEAPIFCGTPKDIADELEAWYVGEACDGFVLSATHRPGTYEDVARLVVPELQRRGLFHRDYKGTTLRENLGLPRSVVTHD